MGVTLDHWSATDYGRDVSSTVVDVVCHHLALVAVDGAGESVLSTRHPEFRLHVDGLTTGAGGYLALIEARWAVEGERPPLDVTRTSEHPSTVTVAIEPACVLRVRVAQDRLVEMGVRAGRRGAPIGSADGDRRRAAETAS